MSGRHPLPGSAATLQRNGYALLTDFDDVEYSGVIQAMEAFQLNFLGRTRSIWGRDFPIPGDALGHYSRQWEYPYVWTNISHLGHGARILDVGSGITFFPFMLTAAGFQIECCDADDELDLADRFRRAGKMTGLGTEFTAGSLGEVGYQRGAFDAAICVSVLEHVDRAARAEMVDAFTAVVRPGGRLVVTCDVDLGRNDGLFIEDVAELFDQLSATFAPTYPFNLGRPRQLLTSDHFVTEESWRLPAPWKPRASSESAPAVDGVQFRSLAILGATMERRPG
jgi:SAM-dependent methyltransferase